MRSRFYFYYYLQIFMACKVISFVLTSLASLFNATNGLGNSSIFQFWQPIASPLNNSFPTFLFEQSLSLVCLIICYYWLLLLRKARKNKFKRFPGTFALFYTVLFLILFTSHWGIALIFISLFFNAKQQKNWKNIKSSNRNISFS